MKRERIKQVSVRELDGVTLDYYMTMDDASENDSYGISIIMKKDTDLVEEYVTVDHMSGDRQEIYRLIERLAKGETFPVSLAEILDDYLGEI